LVRKRVTFRDLKMGNVTYNSRHFTEFLSPGLEDE